VEAERMGASGEELWMVLDLGETLAPVDRDRAIATLHSALAVAETLGSGSARERTGQALRALGVRTWKRMATSRDGPSPALSAREREVLHLIAEGASNPEIASAVFLSRKTVERHVSNILRKLGVRNRTELVAAVARANEGVHR
jgi:DNA-binding NarL/FixJ family response regulator